MSAPRRTHVAVALGFVAFFGLLFLQWPLSGSFPGNCDTWLAAALSDTYLSELGAWASGAPLGRAMYPAADIHPFGEIAPGVGALYLVPRLFGVGDVWAVYLLLVELFATSAFGVYLFARRLTGDAAAAVFAGLAFQTSGFMLGNVDDAVMASWLLPALALLWTHTALVDGRPRLLFLAGAAAGLQIYFSFYVFLYQLVPILLVAGFTSTGLPRRPWRQLLAGAAITLAVALPVLIYYGRAYLALNGFMPDYGENPANAYGLGLHLADLTRPATGNLLYAAPPLDPSDSAYWRALRTSAWPGLAMVVLVGVGLQAAGRARWHLVLLGVAGLTLALGGVQTTGGLIPSPTYALARIIPFFGQLRIVLRGYFLTALALALLASIGLAALRARWAARQASRAALVTAIAFAVVLLENVPSPLPHFRAAAFVDPAPASLAFLDAHPDAVIADLPAGGLMAINAYGEDLFQLNRETVYMLWQTRHHASTINGVNAYPPRTRMELQPALDTLPDPPALEALYAAGVRYLVLHRRMVLPSETDLGARLAKSPSLVRLVDDADVSIFELRVDSLRP